MDYLTLFKSESVGRISYGVDIRVAVPEEEVNLTDDEMWKAGRQAAEIIEQAITRLYYRNNVEAQDRARRERLELVNCFPSTLKVFVNPIPNGYCSRACCEHLPWYEVTTPRGIITVGWRKRVIVVDWEKSPIIATAEELFPAESTTKFGRMIHAHGYEKAAEYITRLLEK
jgi:hypothetical protein